MSAQHPVIKANLNFLLLLQQAEPSLIRDENIRKLIDSYRQVLMSGQLNDLAFDHLLLAINQHLGHSMLVWKIAANIRSNALLTYGAPLLYLMTSPDVKSCVHDLMHFRKLIFRPGQQMTLAGIDKVIRLEFDSIASEEQTRFFKSDFMLSTFWVLLRELAGPCFHFSKLCLPKNRLGVDVDELSRITGAKVEFSEGGCAVEFDTKWLLIENPFYEADLRQNLLEQVNRELLKMDQDESLATVIANYLENAPAPANVTLEQIAERLHKGLSTVRRDLAREKTSFKTIQNHVVSEQAIARLYNSKSKIEEIAFNLGYKDRSSFERFFRKRYSITPSRMRELLQNLAIAENVTALKGFIDDLPPLPNSCQQLIAASHSDTLDLAKTVEIVEQDPIFSARIMGLANKAIYGATTKDLKDAIGRKLGIESVKNLALIYAAKDSLTQGLLIDISELIDAMVLAPKLYQQAFKHDIDLSEIEFSQQTLMFALLGIALLAHERHRYHDKVVSLMAQTDDLFEFNQALKAQLDIGLFATTSLLLASWGINIKVIQNLLQLDQHTLSNASEDSQLNQLYATLTVAVKFIRAPKHLPELQQKLNDQELVQFNCLFDAVERF